MKKKRLRFTLSWKLTFCSIAMMLAMWLAVGAVLVVSTAQEILNSAYPQAMYAAQGYRYDSYLQAYGSYLDIEKEDWWLQHAYQTNDHFLFPSQNNGSSSRYIQYNFASYIDDNGTCTVLPLYTLIGIRIIDDSVPTGTFLYLNRLSPEDLYDLSQQFHSIPSRPLPSLSATGTWNGLLFLVDTLTLGGRTYSTGRTGGTDTILLEELDPNSCFFFPLFADTQQEWKLLMNAQSWAIESSTLSSQNLLGHYAKYTIPMYLTGADPDLWITVVMISTPLRTAFFEHLDTLLLLLVLVPIFGLLFSLLIQKIVVVPLRKTQLDFQKVAALDFQGLEGNIHRGDEIGDLNRSLRQMADELQTRWDDERALEKRRQEFVAAASHELKTPLALMRGYTEGVAQGIGDQEQYLAAIEGEIDRMDSLVMEMLDHTKLDRMEQLTEIKQLDLTTLLNSLLDQMAPLFAGLTLTAQIDAGISLPGDGPLLERAVGNLLSNAAKFCRPGGRVFVSLTDGPVLTVENDADPIPNAELPRLFEMFYRGDKARDRSGSGMGLAIAQKIFALHHLECGVENTDTGVRFTVSPVPQP